MRYFYLMMYIIKGTNGNLHRFFKSNHIPATKKELTNSLRNYLLKRGLSLNDIDILAVHQLSEGDYFEYKEAYESEAVNTN